MLLIGFGGALRCSELVALNVEDIRETESGQNFTFVWETIDIAVTPEPLLQIISDPVTKR